MNNTEHIKNCGQAYQKASEIEEKGLRYNDGKLKWTLIDYNALEPLVEVLEFGTKKYSENNWKKGLYVTDICDSLLRHIYSFLNGENNDKESKLPHIGHILANSMFLSYMLKNKPELDNRHKK
ncbi:MAG: DUF5664 domain-containing protein [Candidatus Woesearchaeota archaeon]